MAQRNPRANNVRIVMLRILRAFLRALRGLYDVIGLAYMVSCLGRASRVEGMLLKEDDAEGRFGKWGSVSFSAFGILSYFCRFAESIFRLD